MRRFYHEVFTLDDTGTGDQKMWMRSADSKRTYINVVNHVRTFALGSIMHAQKYLPARPQATKKPEAYPPRVR